MRGKPLSPSHTTGYAGIKVRINGENNYQNVHRMVAEVYLENPKNYPCVNHKDGNKLNNDVSNLEWCSYIGNANHSVRELGKGCRENHYKQVITEAEVITVCSLLQEGISVKEAFYRLLEAGVVVYPYSIADIRRRRSWKTISENYTW